MSRRPPSSPPFLHDALPISQDEQVMGEEPGHRCAGPEPFHGLHAGERDRLDDGETGDGPCEGVGAGLRRGPRDRKSTRLNSSHVEISYAVFCLKKTMNLTNI